MQPVLVLQVLQRFFHRLEWVQGYDESIPLTYDDLLEIANGSLWGGSDMRRLAQEHPVLDKDNGAWELCLDWIKPFQGVAYSVGVLGIRWVRAGLVRGVGVWTTAM